ncbi:putative zinc ribbon protein [Salmonella enterica]
MRLARPGSESRSPAQKTAQYDQRVGYACDGLSWYCVWCENHYQGDKRCVPCGTGIYSIEDTDAGNL